MTIKRWVTRAAVGTESYRPLVDTNGRLEPDPDEGPFYVLASDHEAEIEALRARVKELEEWQRQMVAKAAEKSLVGYRELGQRCADAEARAEQAERLLGAEIRRSQIRREKLAQAEHDAARRLVLLREVREDATYFGMPTTRIDAELGEKP